MRPCTIIFCGAFLAAIGCSDRDSALCELTDRAHCVPTQRGDLDSTGVVYKYVVDSVELTMSGADRDRLGFDLDDDPSCKYDDEFGFLLYYLIFRLLDIDANASVAELISEGRILQLLEVRATSLDDADGASVRIHIGIDSDGDPSNNFTGTGEFTIDQVFTSVAMIGEVREGVLRADLGVVPLQIAVPAIDDPFNVSLDTAVVELTLGPTAVQGRLGGSFPQQRFDADVTPIIWAGLDRIIAADCTDGTCAQGSRGELLLSFDLNNDGELTLDEFRDSYIAEQLATPDVDLYDSEGRHNPQCDGVLDAHSVGLAFTGVSASF